MKSKLVVLAAVLAPAACLVIACGTDTGTPDDDGNEVVDAGKKKDVSSSSSDGDDGDFDAGTTTTKDSGKDTGSSQPVDAGADANVPWPTCDAQPAGVTAKTIPQIWQANATTATTQSWIAGAYVAAISGSHCAAGVACQLFVQDATSYASLAGAAKHAIKVFVSANTAIHFVDARVGDQVNLLGYPWRYNVDGQNELLVQVNLQLPGCVKTTSTGNTLTPTTVTLADHGVAAYESNGPIFARVDAVSGKPGTNPTETFGLFPTSQVGMFDAGPDAGADITSLSPFFLSGAAFTGLSNSLTNFASITGELGLFVPAGGPKYLELYPRETVDIVVQ